MPSFTPQFGINDINLGLRRQFMSFTAADIRVLKRLAPWADHIAADLVREFYDHQFSFPPTLEFFTAQAQRMNIPLDALRHQLEERQAGYFREIFAEAANNGTYGPQYFAKRLHVGKVHNFMDLPLKWYIGSYPAYFDLAKKYLKKRYLTRPAFRARAERAIALVFNYDMQAITDAFLFSIYSDSIGLDISRITMERPEHDLSNYYHVLKAAVTDTLTETDRTSRTLVTASSQITETVGQTDARLNRVSQAIQFIAQGAQEASEATGSTLISMEQLSQAIESIAQGASEQAHQAQMATATSTEVAAGVEQIAARAAQMAGSARQTRTTAQDGATAVHAAIASMAAIEEVVTSAATKVEELGALGSRIGSVVDMIDDIAAQTNLLALNAAIEAARAGEHGRGFAVVADEVRKLAERSQRETQVINELTTQVQNRTRDAVAAIQTGTARVADGSKEAARAGTALEAILQAVEETVTHVNGIAVATQQMTAGTRSVVDAITSISAVIEENTAATEQLAAQSAGMSVTFRSIATVAANDGTAAADVSMATGEMGVQMQTLLAQAKQLMAAAGQLQELLTRFDVQQEAAPSAPAPRRLHAA